MKEITIEVVKGVEGDCLVINGRRVAGPKPWGGGQIIYQWKTTEKEILKSLDIEDDDEDEVEKMHINFGGEIT